MEGAGGDPVKPAASCSPLPAAATVCRRGRGQVGRGEQGKGHHACLPKHLQPSSHASLGVQGPGGSLGHHVVHAPCNCQFQSVQKGQGLVGDSVQMGPAVHTAAQDRHSRGCVLALAVTRTAQR